MSTWWCKTCGRQISTDKPKPPQAERYCPDHAGGNHPAPKPPKKRKPKTKAPKKAS